MAEHTFAICAYKESPYLEKCIKSLKKQTVESDIIIATSTPCEHILKIAEKYGIPICVRNGISDIAEDWNYAYSKATTPYVTITHQDDIYLHDYVEHVINEFHRSKKPLIFFSDYGELRGKRVIKRNKLLFVKRIMLIPLRARIFFGSRFVRRRILAFGSPICCPSVAYAKTNLPKVIFKTGFRSNEDWEAWEKLSRLKGDFIFDKKILMLHRIHEESETTAIIQDNKRSEEDMVMYSKFWPRPIAKLLVKAYADGQKSNNLDNTN